MIFLSAILLVHFIVIEAVPAAPPKQCYVHLGCLETNNSWYSLNRPFNPPTSPREVINTTFHMYTALTKRDGEAVFMDYETFNTTNFVRNASMNFFIIHGFMSWGKADWILEIKDELLNTFHSEANVFSVDWSGHGLDYAQAAANSRVVGLEIAKFIDSILIRMYNMSGINIHLIGHSLGAHVAGYVGERMPDLYRITGLDPAGLHFAGMPAYVRLDANDAKFVDVIHTDPTGYGTNQPMGHVDFYGNSEGSQPGCGALNMVPQIMHQGMNATLHEASTCSHSRSHQYFIESLQSYNKSSLVICKIVAYHCQNFNSLNDGKCINNCHPNDDSGKCMFIGLEAKPIGNQRNVVMYFRTSSYKPYCLTPYRLYIDVIGTTSPIMYINLFLDIYDDKGSVTVWNLNNGRPIAVQPHTLISALIFSHVVLPSANIKSVDMYWNSRSSFNFMRRSPARNILRSRALYLTTIDGKRLMLCPKKEVEYIIREYAKVTFSTSSCNIGNVTSDTTPIPRNTEQNATKLLN